MTLRSVISLSSLSKADESPDLLEQLRQSLADITNNALAGITAPEYQVTAEDINILSTADGSLVVDYEVALPPDATAQDGSSIPPEELSDLSTAALTAELSDTAATSQVLESNGLPEGTGLTVVSAPEPTVSTPPPGPPAPAVPPMPPLPLDEGDGGSSTPWWHPSSFLMMAIISGVGVLLLAGVVALIAWLCTRKREKVIPRPAAGDVENNVADTADGVNAQYGPSTAMVDGNHSAVNGAMVVAQAAPRAMTAPALPDEPPPSWKQPSPNVKPRPYKGTFQPFMSTPRSPDVEPYERLVMISSRVPGAMGIKDAVLHSKCAVVVYDWKLYTLQELLGHVKRVLAGRKVKSIGIIAPAGKPGAVGILEGYQTTPQKLEKKPELTQFWKVLAGHVAPQTNAGTAGGLDFLCCRVLEQPAAGAELLRSLGGLLSQTVSASDDPENSFPLSKAEVAPDGSAYAADTGNLAMDLYFDEEAMLSALKAVPRALTHATPTIKMRQLAPLESPPKTGPPSPYLALSRVLTERRSQIEAQYPSGEVPAEQLAGLFQVPPPLSYMPGKGD